MSSSPSKSQLEANKTATQDLRNDFNSEDIFTDQTPKIKQRKGSNPKSQHVKELPQVQGGKSANTRIQHGQHGSRYSPYDSPGSTEAISQPNRYQTFYQQMQSQNI